jgi:predicted NBD/HSP70 family sugar kinase
MLHAGLDLSRRKVDVCLLSSQGEIVDEWASPPDADVFRVVAAVLTATLDVAAWTRGRDHLVVMMRGPAGRERLGVHLLT